MTVTYAGNIQPWAQELKRLTDVVKEAEGDLATLDATHTDLAVDLTTGNNRTITGVTKANPCVVTAAGHGLSDNDSVRIFDAVGMHQLNGRWLVEKVSNDVFNLRKTSGEYVDSTAWTDYVDRGKVRQVPASVSESGNGNLDGLEFDRDEADAARLAVERIRVAIAAERAILNKVADANPS